VNNLNRKWLELSQIYFQDLSNKASEPKTESALTAPENDLLLIQLVEEMQYHLGINQDLESMYTNTKSVETLFYQSVQEKLQKVNNLIDLGAGVRPFRLVPKTSHIIVEPFEPYLKFLQERESGRNVVLVQDQALSFLQKQASNSVDLIVAIDLIEHLTKTDGEQLILEMKRVCKNQYLVITPLGFAPQHVGLDDDEGWGFKGNTLQTHISGWLPSDFSECEVIVAPEYTYSSEHKGNIAAIYTKPESITPIIEIVVISKGNRKVEISMNSLLSIIQELKDQPEYQKIQSSVRVWLPIEFHPFSQTINPALKYATNMAYYIENSELYSESVAPGTAGRLKPEYSSHKFCFGLDRYSLDNNLHKFLAHNDFTLAANTQAENQIRDILANHPLRNLNR
jgi:hypothetical protein